MNNTIALKRCAIKELEVDMPNIMLLGLLIGKQEPRRFKRNDDRERNENAEERGVWNFTIRDSPRDYINVTFWGAADNVCGIETIAQIGSILEITQPRVLLRNAEDVGERYRPIVTSAFQLVVNEGIGTINKVRDYRVDGLSRLLHLPTKPIFNFTTLANVYTNIHTLNGSLVDLLVAVRQIGEMRIVNTKNGLKEVRNVIVFDNTNPGMAISLWNQEYIARASLWQPRNTILFITDAKVHYDRYSNSPKGSMSLKSIITENPEGGEAQTLLEYAKNAPLHSSTVLDQLVGVIPDASSIKTVMNIRQICNKIDQIQQSNSVRIEDQQFAIVVYAIVTDFDLDGNRSVFCTRCSLCKSIISKNNELDRCANPLCLSNSSKQTMEFENAFDIRLHLSDKTGTLKHCRLNGKNAEAILRCSPSTFLAMSDMDKSDLKWNFLLELCELRLIILLKNKRPLITVLTCERADVSQLVANS